MNPFEKKIKTKILSAVDGDLAAVTPGLCLQVVAGGRLKADLRLGSTYAYYDLASLTKIIFTVPAFMKLFDEKRFRLKDPVSAVLSWWPHRRVRFEQVLSHSGGLPWWAPFYKKLDLKKTVAERREHVRRILQKTVLSKSETSVYSDLDFILLGFALEELYKSSLEGPRMDSFEQPHAFSLHQIWESLKWREKTPSLHFNVGNRPLYKRALYAPTERCPWRKKILQGEVHDDNTWSFGGVSTHAGLFGSIDDVTRYGLLLRNAHRERSARLGSAKTVRKFCRRAIPVKQGDWALGFMLPTRGSASCGRHFHASSFGHTGFTGTSIWYDPQKDLLVTLLSNRVHPTRENTRFVKLRPLIHDLIVENL